MKRFLRAAFALAALIACVSINVPAFGQGSPGFVLGFVPTPAQWNTYFANKTDVTNGLLINPTITNPKAITGVTAPVNAGDAVNKDYVDTHIVGITPAQGGGVRLITTAPLAANNYANGTLGVGATLTATGNGALSIDGIAVAVSDRLLIDGENTASHNGCYVVTQVGDGSHPYILTRCTDWDQTAEMPTSSYFFVSAGVAAHAATGWFMQTHAPITVGTTSISFAQFSAANSYSAGTGLGLAGNQFSLGNTTVAAGTYGDGTHIPVVTLDAQGRATNASNVSIGPNLPISGYFSASGAGPNSSSQSNSVYALSQIRFRQAVGDETNAGVIDYGTIDSGALDIIGKGPNIGSRDVNIYDNLHVRGTLTIDNSLSLSRLALTGGSLSVVNNFNPVGSTGINPGFRVMIGANQSATPGVNDAVAGTVYIDNLNGRGQAGGLWALDILTLQANGGNDSISHSIEVEVNNLGAAPTDPFSNIQGARKDGIELVAHNSSTANPTSALWVWGASATTSTWWNVGLAMSRVNLDGIVFENYASDTAAFSDAAIWDNSRSNRVLKVSGKHNNIFDFSGETQLGLGDTFIHLPQTYSSTLLIQNFANFAANLTLSSGNGTPQSAFWQFADNNTIWWAVGKNNGNAYTIFNVQTAKTDLQVTTGDVMILSPNFLSVPSVVGVGQGAASLTSNWLETYVPSSSSLAQFASIANAVTPTIGTIGVLGAARTSDFSTAGINAYGLAGFAINDHATQADVAWGGLFLAVRKTAAVGATLGLEIEAANAVNGIVDVAPFAMFPGTGLTGGVWIAPSPCSFPAGSGICAAPTFNASAAIGVVGNGAVLLNGNTHNNTTIDGISSTTNIVAGGPINGECLPSGTTVVSKGANSVVISNAATCTSTITFNYSSVFRKGIVIDGWGLDASAGPAGTVGVALEMGMKQVVRWMDGSNTQLVALYADASGRLNMSGGKLTIQSMITSCGGQPTGTLINNSGVANVCP